VSEWTRLTLYKAPIAPHFEYCSTVMWNMSSKNFKILQRLQNKAMRIIIRCHKRTHVKDMLEVLCWMSIEQRVIFNTLLFIFKIKNNLVPEYLCKKISKNSEMHEHNTRKCNDFFIKSQSSAALKKSVFQSGLSEYNKMPNDLKNEMSVNGFRRKLSNYVKLNYPYV
jgi:hypothetical protein